MCCLAAVLIGLLGLAAPGFVARDSLVGAYAMILVLAGIIAAYLIRRSRIRTGDWRSRALVVIGGGAAVYAGVVTLVHFV